MTLCDGRIDGPIKSFVTNPDLIRGAVCKNENEARFVKSYQSWILFELLKAKRYEFYIT